VKRSRPGVFKVRISKEERDVLRSLPEQLRDLLTDGDRVEDPALRRLYPAAHLDDPVASAEFDDLTGDDLTATRMSAIDTMSRTIDATGLSEEELLAWLGAVNDLRLVLGVRLAVTEESEPEDFAGDPEREGSFALYRYLSVLEEDIVLALSEDSGEGSGLGPPPVV
jgi:hypothetical protein